MAGFGKKYIYKTIGFPNLLYLSGNSTYLNRPFRTYFILKAKLKFALDT